MTDGHFFLVGHVCSDFARQKDHSKLGNYTLSYSGVGTTGENMSKILWGFQTLSLILNIPDKLPLVDVIKSGTNVRVFRHFRTQQIPGTYIYDNSKQAEIARSSPGQNDELPLDPHAPPLATQKNISQ